MKHSTASARRRVAGLVLLPALLAGGLGLSSCSANRGTEAAGDFETAVKGLSGVSEVDATGSNSLPFSGSGTAKVTVDPGLGTGQLKDLAHRIGGLAKQQGGMNWSDLALHVGEDVVVIVPGQDDITDSRLERWSQLKGSGHFSQLSLGTRRGGVTGTVASGPLCELENRYDELARESWPGAAGTTLAVTVRQAPPKESSFGDDRSGTRPGPVGRGVFRAICGEASVSATSITFDASRMRVEVATPAQAKRVIALVNAVPGGKDFKVTVSSGSN